MPKIHTHYDNLKVSRDAPIEVIRAAHRSLLAMYHPDLNPGDTRAVRISAIINRSYAVLSDPAKRQAHDEWIAQTEWAAQQEPPPPPKEPPPQTHIPVSQTPSEKFLGKYSLRAVVVLSFVVIVGIAAVASFYGLFQSVPSVPVSVSTAPPSPAPSATKGEPDWIVEKETPILPPPPAGFVVDTPANGPRVPTPAPQAPPRRLFQRYERPALAPNGAPWPTTSGYLDGYAQGSTGGLSNLTVDNRQSGSDALVGIYDHDHDQPLRVFFLRAGDQFTAVGFLPGDYDVRYMDLDSGIISRSDKLQFLETHGGNAIYWHDSTVTLYTERNPEHPIHFERIGPSEFVMPPRQ